MAKANVQEQKRFLRDKIRDFHAQISQWRLPREKEPPAKVRKAEEDIKRLEAIVVEWDRAEEDRRSAIRNELRDDLAAIRRSFAFKDPVETLALCDAFDKKLKKYAA